MKIISFKVKEEREEGSDTEPSSPNPSQCYCLSASLEIAENALSNDRILKFILRHVNTGDLIGKRLVSSQWNRAVNKILKNRTDACIRVDEQTDFGSLEGCIKSSTEFPFRDIHLVCTDKDFAHCPEGWLKVELIRHYASLFSRLQLSCSGVPGGVVTDLLTGPFNHIESLTLHPISLNHHKRNIVFPHDRANLFKELKIITVGTRTGCEGIDLTFFAFLLQSCSNLQRIDNITNAHLPAVATAGKLEAVKLIRVCCCINVQQNYPAPAGVETLLIDFADHICSHLTTRDLYQVNFCRLQPLLVSSRETIRRIEVCTPVLGGEKFMEYWPPLAKLTSLKLMKPFNFPASVEHTFPALETIQLCAFKNENFDLRPGMWTEPLLSVTNLEIFRSLSSEEWKCLSQVVPNVRRAFLDWDSIGDDKASDLWASLSLFTHLEVCTISPIKFPGTLWDELFTGIPEAWATILRKYPHVPTPAPEFIDFVLREKKSVSSVSGLKELVVHLTVSDESTEEDVMTGRLFSYVALQYGFVLAPEDLQIVFIYDHGSKNAHLMEEALEPLSERVTFGHWNANLRDNVEGKCGSSAWQHFYFYFPAKGSPTSSSTKYIPPIQKKRRIDYCFNYN